MIQLRLPTEEVKAGEEHYKLLPAELSSKAVVSLLVKYENI